MSFIDQLENELLFRSLDASRVGLCVVGRDERVILMTAMFAEKLALDAVATVGRNVRSILSERLAITTFDAVFLVASNETAVEVPISREDHVAVVLLQGKSIRLSAHASEDEFRVISAIEVTDFGVTPNRMSELRRQLDAMNSAVVIADCTKPDMPIVLVNRRFRTMTGYSPEEVIGRNCRFLQGDDHKQLSLTSLRSALAAGRSAYAVIRNYRKDGSMFYNELFVSPIQDERGVLTHYVGLQREYPARH